MRHILSLTDMSSAEISRVLELSSEMKQQMNEGERPSLMQNHVMGLLFQKPSLRTRVSFESLMAQLGGSSLFLGPDVGWGSREPMQDFMPILTNYLDVLVIRANDHNSVVEATEYSRCPIINGLTNVSHPCQALADILTVRELTSASANPKITYLGDGNNVAFSLAIICSRLGIRLTIGAPKEYQFQQRFVDELNEFAGQVVIDQNENPIAAVDDANILYTDVWASMGQEAESAKRIRDLTAFQVNEKLMKSAADDCKLLHCLPARRGEEVTAEVIEGPQSVIVQQAENRLHAQKGLLVWLLNENKNPES